LRDVRRAEDGVDDREEVDSAFEQRGSVLRRDAPDGDDGDPDARAHRGDEPGSRPDRAGLGDGGEEASEGDVVRSVPGGGESAVRLVVAGDADDRVVAEPGPGVGEGLVIPAEVDAVRPCGEREVDVVVDDEGHVPRAADLEERFRVAVTVRIRGDTITFDVAARTLSVDLSDEEIRERASAWRPSTQSANGSATGVMRKYARLVASASEGAVTNRA